MNRKESEHIQIGEGYRHIISLGSFCSTSSEIERLGYRDGSYPFDWVLSHTMKNVLMLIENNFEGLFEDDYIYQWKDELSTYENTKYDIIFVHDFSKWKRFEQQLPDIREKYQRRIVRFYKAISEKTLFVRYIETAGEYSYIEKNHSMIMKSLKKYNPENNILFIANEDVYYNKNNIVENVLFVDKDKNDTVARRFAEKSPEFCAILENAYYSDQRRNENLVFYANKHKYDKIKKIAKKSKRVIMTLTKCSYTYQKQL